jgi:hypothetical protein
MRTAAVDMLRRGAEFLVSEVSFWYEPFTIRRCRSHWRLDGDELQRVEGAVEPEAAILDDFLSQLALRRS